MDILIAVSCICFLGSTITYFAFLILQKAILHRCGQYLLFAGFAALTIAIAGRWIASGHLPARNLHETLTIAGWAIAGVFLGLTYRLRLQILGVFAAPLVFLIVLFAIQIPSQPAPSQDLYRSFWLILHVLSIFVGEGALALACGAGILYLIQERTIKSKRPGFFYKRLPSLELLDSTGYVCIVTGFTMITVGLITGLIFAKSVWGRFWAWDPKEVWSAITWMIYAALLHERLAVGWRGRRSAIFAIIGFAVILFTFIGVNFLFRGHHGAFTQF